MGTGSGGPATDSPRNVRARAAYTLAELGPQAESAIPALQDALKERDGNVRAAAKYALGQIQKKP